MEEIEEQRPPHPPLPVPRALVPFWKNETATLYHRDSLAILRDMPSGFADAVVTDPPYSSGGFTRADRNMATSDKYQLGDVQKKHAEFFGDNRDQRSFLAWCSLWMAECVRIVRPGGHLFTFTDWRQLPVMSDAIQAGGWVWRGIVPWDKTEACRPVMGWFRAQAEYCLTATNGPAGKEQERSVRVCAPGVVRSRVVGAEKRHMTAKPVQVMETLMSVLPPGAVVVDPFMGSGTTLVAAQNMGFTAHGIDMALGNAEIARDRLSQSRLSFGHEPVQPGNAE